MKFLKFPLIIFLIIQTQNVMAQSESEKFVNENGVALSGYDLVSYFTENAAIRGSKKHSVNHDGVTYYFVNGEHESMFSENPDKYLPQYGGYCAFAVAAQNAKVPSDPETFKLYNGNLYLFFNDYYEGEPFNTIIPWNDDEANLKENADANWSKMN